MKRGFRWITCIIGCLCLCGLSSTVQSAPSLAVGGVDHRILVMLRLQPEHNRPGAGFGGGYGSGASRVARRRLAERLAHLHGLAVVDNWPMPLISVDCFIMSVPGARSPADAVAALSGEPDVSWAQLLQEFHGLASRKLPNDPLYPLQPAASAWRLADLHDLTQGRGARIAVIDSRVDSAHPDLKGQIYSSRDFVTGHPGGAEMHGTAVAGVIAAIANNGVGIVGIAPGAKIMALRACWQGQNDPSAACDSLSLAKALQFALDNRAQIINLSLGGPPDRLLSVLIATALARHLTVVAAVDPKLPQGGFPASQRGVLAVTDDIRQSRENSVFFAPGRDVPATKPEAKWTMVNGSSFSAAHVSGLVALMFEHSRSREIAKIVRTKDGAIDAYLTVLETLAKRR